jgi:hypothetical protein
VVVSQGEPSHLLLLCNRSRVFDSRIRLQAVDDRRARSVRSAWYGPFYSASSRAQLEGPKCCRSRSLFGKALSAISYECRNGAPLSWIRAVVPGLAGFGWATFGSSRLDAPGVIEKSFNLSVSWQRVLSPARLFRLAPPEPGSWQLPAYGRGRPTLRLSTIACPDCNRESIP